MIESFPGIDQWWFERIGKNATFRGFFATHLEITHHLDCFPIPLLHRNVIVTFPLLAIAKQWNWRNVIYYRCFWNLYKFRYFSLPLLSWFGYFRNNVESDHHRCVQRGVKGSALICCEFWSWFHSIGFHSFALVQGIIETFLVDERCQAEERQECYEEHSETKFTCNSFFFMKTKQGADFISLAKAYNSLSIRETTFLFLQTSETCSSNWNPGNWDVLTLSKGCRGHQQGSLLSPFFTGHRLFPYLNEQWWNPSLKSAAFSKNFAESICILDDPRDDENHIKDVHLSLKIIWRQVMINICQVHRASLSAHFWQIHRLAKCIGMMLLFLYLIGETSPHKMCMPLFLRFLCFIR